MGSKDRFEVLLEDLHAKMDGLVEIVQPIPPRLEKTEQRLEKY